MTIDPSLRTDCPPAIKGKITQLMNATVDAALAGSMHPHDAAQARQYRDHCRYDLERTILTHLGRSK